MTYSLTLRPTCADDETFLFRVFCGAHAATLASLDLPAEQKEHLLRMQFDGQQQQYRRQYPDADFDLVLLDDEPIGLLYAQRGPEQFVLIDISLLSDRQNSGIGTQLIRELIAQAAAANKPLHAHVLKSNPAWRLWQRLGFRQVNDDGVYLSIEVPPGDVGTG